MASIRAADINTLPHDYDAESAVLSSCLLDPDAMARAQEAGLEPSDFFRVANGTVYGVMLDLAQRHEPVDLVTVGDALTARGQDDVAPNGLIAMVDVNVSTIHVVHHAEIVKRHAERRNILRATAEIAKAVHDYEDGPLDDLRDQVSQLLADAVGRPTDGTHWMGTPEEMLDYLTWQEMRAEFLESHPNTLIHTGLGGVDSILDELPEETVTVIAARAGIGKTMAMEQLAEYNAMRGHTAVFYHYELSTLDMLHRRTTRHTGVPFRALRRGKGAREYRHDFNKLYGELEGWAENEIFVHCNGWTAGRVAADITRLHNLGKCDLAVVDYLQMIPLPEGRDSGNIAQKYGQMVDAFKTCAAHLGIPIVLGSQVKRVSDGRPTDEDLRNSGETKEKANQIIILHRPNDRPGDAIPQMGATEVIEAYVDKSTYGPTGKATLEHMMGWFCLGDPEAPAPVYEDVPIDF